MEFKIWERETASVMPKEKIYVTGHPKDRLNINGVVGEILLLRDCKVYTAIETEEYKNYEECCCSLAGVNLVVVLVSRAFINTPNQAFDMELCYVKENNIPLLPILIEKGIEEEFNKVCGCRHLINGCENRNYKDQLQKHLNELFGNDKQSLEIHKVFAGKIFLSYRKQEREQVLRLITFIHEKKSCQDISIWFDDFLTFGEEYNEEIEKNMAESDLLILLVTPSLLTDGNYVLTTEYPKALQLKKKIIPVEMIPTDREELQLKYPQLPECIPFDDLLEKKILEVRQNQQWENYPEGAEKEYLLGEAYLNGIGVEINRGYGIEHLTKSAKADFVKAINALVHVYCVGIGIPANIKIAQQWMEKEAQLNWQEYEKENSEEQAYILARSLRSLFTCYWEQNQLSKAEQIGRKLEEVTCFLWNRGCTGKDVNPGVVWLQLGMICFKEAKYEMALEYYDKADEILTEMYKQLECEQTLRDYALLKMEQGNLYNRVFENTENFVSLQNALYYFEEAKQKWESLLIDYTVYKKKSDVKNLADTYFNMGSLYTAFAMKMSQQDLEKALDYLDTARNLLRAACKYAEDLQLPDTNEYLFEYVLETYISANWKKSRGEIEKAKHLYTEACNYLEKICKDNPDNSEYLSVRREIEICLNSL